MPAAPGAPSAGPAVAGLHLSMGDLPLSYVIQRLIARQLDADEGIEVDPEAVVVTTGSQEALFPLGVQRRRARDVPPAVTPAGAGVTGAACLLGPPVHLVAKAPDGGDLADQRWRVHQVRAAGLGPRALYVVTDHANSYGFHIAPSVRRASRSGTEHGAAAPGKVPHRQRSRQRRHASATRRPGHPLPVSPPSCPGR